MGNQMNIIYTQVHPFVSAQISNQKLRDDPRRLDSLNSMYLTQKEKSEIPASGTEVELVLEESKEDLSAS